MRVLLIPGSTLFALRRHVLANCFKTSSVVVVAWPQLLESLWLTDAARAGASTASIADIAPVKCDVRFTPKSARSGHSIRDDASLFRLACPGSHIPPWGLAFLGHQLPGSMRRLRSAELR
jgi:hypothetical protein